MRFYVQVMENQEVMMEILANFIFYAVKVIIYAGLAYGGIIAGKKLREKKNLQNGK